MIRSLLNLSAPFFVATIGDPAGSFYGLPAGVFGVALFVVAFFLIIANQIWTLAEKWRKSVRSPEVNTTGFASTDICDERYHQITAALAGLKAEDERQDRINKDQFNVISAALDGIKRDMRDDIKGLHKRSDDVLRAVSRLEGRVNS